jgi:SIR2-like domain
MVSIDPLLALAVSMHAQKGIYALLLGSGVSRSAQIPTGWEVVLDLASRLAAGSGERCEGEAAASWYKTKYGELPDYSRLLDDLAATPTERQQLLRDYFEPTEEEAEQGIKTPTLAHKAIAELAREGQIRVVLTTNFDRLAERAIEAQGITPAVITTPEAAEGALPLAHSPCTVIKLHGDYLDTRLKNTVKELETYDARIDGLLDRVLDEYGLIVCGWSAQWDRALRAAFERRHSRRFSIYWVSRGEPGEEARRLIDLCQARVIPSEGADYFFPILAEKVRALRDLEASDPLPPAVAAATVKRYLAEDRRGYLLVKLFSQHTKTTSQSFFYLQKIGSLSEGWALKCPSSRLKRRWSRCDIWRMFNRRQPGWPEF